MLFLQIPLAQGLNQIANIIKGFAIAIGVAIAIGFVWMWWKNRVRERSQELSARAGAIYSDHLRFAVDHPEFADPMLGGLTSPVEVARYKSFVASLLTTADEILLLQPTPQWRDALLRQIAPHRSFLASDEFHATILAGCSPEVKALVDRIVRG
jgi:hypothetical protein